MSTRQIPFRSGVPANTRTQAPTPALAFAPQGHQSRGNYLLPHCGRPKISSSISISQSSLHREDAECMLCEEIQWVPCFIPNEACNCDAASSDLLAPTSLTPTLSPFHWIEPLGACQCIQNPCTGESATSAHSKPEFCHPHHNHNVPATNYASSMRHPRGNNITNYGNGQSFTRRSPSHRSLKNDGTQCDQLQTDSRGTQCEQLKVNKSAGFLQQDSSASQQLGAANFASKIPIRMESKQITSPAHYLLPNSGASASRTKTKRVLQNQATTQTTSQRTKESRKRRSDDASTATTTSVAKSSQSSNSIRSEDIGHLREGRLLQRALEKQREALLAQQEKQAQEQMLLLKNELRLITKKLEEISRQRKKRQRRSCCCQLIESSPCEQLVPQKSCMLCPSCKISFFDPNLQSLCE